LDQEKGAPQVDKEQIEQIILAKVGLTDDELRDFLAKVSVFYDGLTAKEKQKFRSSMRVSPVEVFKTFGCKITPKQLEEFIKSREPRGASVGPVMLVHCKQQSE